MTFEEANEHKKSLLLEVEILKDRYQPTETGTLRTAVHVLMFYIGQAGVVGAYMGMTAYMSAKK
jgi:hypothetical protein